MENCNSVATLIDRDTEFDKSTIDDGKRKPYWELIDILMYLAISTRPDIAHAVLV